MPEHHVLTAGFIPASGLPGVAFPAFPDPQRSLGLALLAQLAETQWWSPERLREHQLQQLTLLVRHAARTTRHGRRSFPELAREPLTWERWASLPLLDRRQVQSKRRSLVAERLPKGHVRAPEASTSGSTGTPVVVERTAIGGVIWNALTARDHLWFERDTSLLLASIRLARGADYPSGSRTPVWGLAASWIGPPGPCDVLDIDATTEQQLEWLLRRRFSYLLLYPSGLVDLLELTRRRGVSFPDLRAVRTFGEVVDPELRERVRAWWGVPLQDVYSAQEVGYIGLQCPEHPHYHVQSEAILVEVLRDDGTPCEVGEEGRLVVTPLHNFAMPLLRYDIGDYGVLGPPCPCGRGLPVLAKVIGRVHQSFLCPDGSRVWPTLSPHRLGEVAPVVQYQLRQVAIGHLEARLVASRQPTADEEQAIRDFLLLKLPEGARVTIRWMDEIPRAASGKYFDYLSEIE